jgi:hypothetical protein
MSEIKNLSDKMEKKHITIDCITINWLQILSEIPVVDWPIISFLSCIESGIFDSEDIETLKTLVAKAFSKMPIKNQLELFQNLD